MRLYKMGLPLLIIFCLILISLCCVGIIMYSDLQNFGDEGYRIPHIAFDWNGQQKVAISLYPDGYDCAFTFTDDADYGKLAYLKPIYAYLNSQHMYGLKTVWVRDSNDKWGRYWNWRAETTNNTDYYNWTLDLKLEGFNIGMHTVSGSDDTREQTIWGYEKFKKLYGYYPEVNILHSNNLENLWESPFKHSHPVFGADKNSTYYWADICKDKTKYVRCDGLYPLNSSKSINNMFWLSVWGIDKCPWHDKNYDYVNFLFPYIDGSSKEQFLKIYSLKNIDSLQKERGFSIMFAHFWMWIL